ncbi:34664_t:CDS:1, partial [Racocetra persica]
MSWNVIHFRAIYDEISRHKVPFIDQLEHVNADETKTPFMIFSPKG